MKTLKSSKQVIFLILLSLIFSIPCFSATYYVATNGNNTTGDGSMGNPWATWEYAFIQISSGDTLIIEDGIYNADLGTWHWSGGSQVPDSTPPNGTSENYTIIQARNVNKAVANKISMLRCEYIRVEGVKALSGVSIHLSHHCEFKKAGVKGGISCSASSYIIKEDVWAWHDNRYVIHNYGSDHIIDNRVIARLDDLGVPPPLPVGAMSHYLTDYSVIAHALIFDVTGTFDQPYDAIYSSRPAIGCNQICGTIIFNVGSQLGGIFPGDACGGENEIYNCVVWGTEKRGIRFNSPGPNLVENCTIANNAWSAVAQWHDITINNNILTDNGGVGDANAGDGNVIYNCGDIPGVLTNTDESNPNVKYLPRSPIEGKGASVEKKYEITEVGGKFVVTETDEDLWPWPYEDLIKADLSENSSYGLCGTDKTLTEYIWEYLGNTIPPEIYENSISNIYYVSPSGDDLNNGSIDYPWATLQHAANTVQPGDIVLVNNGNYSPFHITTSGEQTKRIIFKTNGQNVNINEYESYDGRYTTIQILGDYITIDGFNINVGAVDDSVKSRGIRISGVNGDHIMEVIVKNNIVQNAGWCGITASYAENLLLENNNVSESKGQHGIYVANSADNPIIRGNICYDNDEIGINVNADPELPGDRIISNALIENNIVYNNVNGIDLASVRSSIIRNNFIYENNSQSLVAWDDGAGNEWGCKNNKFLNNTVIIPAGANHGFSLRNGSTGNTIKNNILISIDGGDSISVDPESITDLDSDYNIVTKIEYNWNLITLDIWQSNYNQGINSFIATVDNVFTNVSESDYRLYSTSPAIDAGADLGSDVINDLIGTYRPQGSGYDIGAYEFKMTPTTPNIISIESISPTMIDLEWENVSGESSYTLFRSLANNPGTAMSIAGFSVNETTYLDTGLAPSTTYYYWVKAYNIIGDSGFSSAASNTTLYLSGHWKFDEEIGTNAYDSIGNSDGVVYNAVWTNGKKDGALSFDGNNDYVKVPFGNGIDPSTIPLTYILWVKSDDPSADKMCLIQGNWSGEHRMYFGHNGGYWRMGIQESSWFDGSTIASADTSWHMLTLVFNGTEAKLYVDDNFAYEKSYTSFTFNQDLTIGSARPMESSHDWDGIIDNVRVYDYALSKTEISNIFNAATNIPPSAPQWVFVTAVSTNQIDLRWNDLSNESSYTLFRSLTNNTGMAVSIDGFVSNVIDCNDTGLATDTTYFYWVKAYNEYGASDFSIVGSDTTLQLPPPDVTTIISIEAVSSFQIELTWKDVSNENSYMLFRNRMDNTSTAENIAVVLANVTEYSDKELEPDTAYYYWIKGRNEHGTSDFSVVAHAKTFVLCSPDLENLIIGPSPYKPNDDDYTTGIKEEGITFGNLTKDAEIEIYTINGQLIAKMIENDGDGKYVWKVSDKIASGVYICRITNSKGEKKIRKVVIIK